MVKQSNVTSAVLQDILLDIQSYKKAILQNIATIDCCYSMVLDVQHLKVCAV